MRKRPSLGAADVRDLDHGAGMGLGVEIGEPPFLAADTARVAHLVAQRERLVVKALIVFGPVGHVLQALMAGLEELPVHRGRLIARLDQLDLQVPGIGEGNAHLRVRFPAPVAEPVGLDVLDIEPRPHTHHGYPVVHRGLDVADDIVVLANLPENPAQSGHSPDAPFWGRPARKASVCGPSQVTLGEGRGQGKPSRSPVPRVDSFWTDRSANSALQIPP